MGSRHLITKKMKISKISLVLLMLMIHFSKQQITFNLSTFNVVTLASGIGVLAFLGYAAGKSLKRGRFQNSSSQPHFPPSHFPHYPLQRDLHYSEPQPRYEEGSERKTKEFLIHKGDKEVGRGWFYLDNRKQNT